MVLNSKDLITRMVSVAFDFGRERLVSTSDIVLSCSVVDGADDILVEQVLVRSRERARD